MGKIRDSIDRFDRERKASLAAADLARVAVGIESLKWVVTLIRCYETVPVGGQHQGYLVGLPMHGISAQASHAMYLHLRLRPGASTEWIVKSLGFRLPERLKLSLLCNPDPNKDPADRRDMLNRLMCLQVVVPEMVDESGKSTSIANVWGSNRVGPWLLEAMGLSVDVLLGECSRDGVAGVKPETENGEEQIDSLFFMQCGIRHIPEVLILWESLEGVRVD